MQNTPTVSNANVPSTAATLERVKLGQFTGAFQRFGVNWFGLLFAYGISKLTAHKIAVDAMSSLGLAMASGNAELAAAISKANKQGESTFKISGKSGLTAHSNALAIIRLCQLLEKVRDEKLFVERPQLPSIKGLLTPEHVEYLEKCAKWNVEVIS